MTSLPLLRSLVNHSDLGPDVDADVGWGKPLNLGFSK